MPTLPLILDMHALIRLALALLVLLPTFCMVLYRICQVTMCLAAEGIVLSLHSCRLSLICILIMMQGSAMAQHYSFDKAGWMRLHKEYPQHEQYPGHMQQCILFLLIRQDSTPYALKSYSPCHGTTPQACFLPKPVLSGTQQSPTLLLGCRAETRTVSTQLLDPCLLMQVLTRMSGQEQMSPASLLLVALACQSGTALSLWLTQSQGISQTSVWWCQWATSLVKVVVAQCLQPE